MSGLARDLQIPAKKSHRLLAVIFVLTTVMLGQARDTEAIPAFARNYSTSCISCHNAFPRLNAFGVAFRANGYRIPNIGQSLIGAQPISLGAPSQKRVWPQSVWPSDIPALPPIAVRVSGGLVQDGNISSLTFELPHELELLFGGPLGEDVSVFGEVEIEGRDEVAYEFRIQYDFSAGLHVRAGSVGLPHVLAPVTSDRRRLTRTHYNLDQLETLSGVWNFGNGAGGGLEIWGAGDGPGDHGGGYTWSLGIGNGPGDEDNKDRDRRKDVFGRVTYKFGGAGQATATNYGLEPVAGYLRDDAVRIGAFHHAGSGPDAKGQLDTYRISGADLAIWHGPWSTSGGFMSLSSEYGPDEVKIQALFAEASYMAYPWMWGYLRWEREDSDDSVTGRDRQRLIPAVIVLARANIRLSLETRIPLESGAGQPVGILTVDLAF